MVRIIWRDSAFNGQRPFAPENIVLITQGDGRVVFSFASSPYVFAFGSDLHVEGTELPVGWINGQLPYSVSGTVTKVTLGNYQSDLMEISMSFHDFLILRAFGGLPQYLGGDDTIITGDFNDVIWDGAGNDTVVMGAGNDVLHAGTGSDYIDGGAGYDRVIYDGSRADFEFAQTNSQSFHARFVAGGQIIFDDNLIGIERVEFGGGYAYNPLAVDQARQVDFGTLQTISQMYVAYLDRLPEAQGLGYWASVAGSGISRDALFDRFYQEALGTTSLTDDEYVRLLYANVQNRHPWGDLAPTESEVGYWVSKLASNELDRGDVANEFILATLDLGSDSASPYFEVYQLLQDKTQGGVHYAYYQGLERVEADQTYMFHIMSDRIEDVGLVGLYSHMGF
jgi:hypothetical protein